MNLKSLKPAFTQKILKKMIVKSQTCIYSKKTKKIRLYVGLTGIDELVFDFFDFLSICRVGDFSLSFF